MRGTLRGLGSLGALVVMAVACGGSPQPITGHAYWQDGCEADSPGGSCLSQNHLVSGDMGSSAVIIDCNIQSIGGGATNIILDVASGQGSFDSSSEGIALNINTMGQAVEAYGGTLQVQGNGWSITNENVGPSTMCHVFVDDLSSTGITGRIRCDEAHDSSQNLKYVHGVPSFTADPAYAEFKVANCNNVSL